MEKEDRNLGGTAALLYTPSAGKHSLMEELTQTWLELGFSQMLHYCVSLPRAGATWACMFRAPFVAGGLDKVFSPSCFLLKRQLFLQMCDRERMLGENVWGEGKLFWDTD